jgi:hypothetical protein
MEAAPRRLSNLLADADRRSSGNPYPKYAAYNVRPRLKVPQPKGIDAPLWFPAKEKRFNWRTFCSPLIEELVWYQRESQNGLESTENRRSVRRNGNQHVHVRCPQVSGAARTSRAPSAMAGLSCWVSHEAIEGDDTLLGVAASASPPMQPSRMISSRSLGNYGDSARAIILGGRRPLAARVNLVIRSARLGISRTARQPPSQDRILDLFQPSDLRRRQLALP